MAMQGSTDSITIIDNDLADAELMVAALREAGFTGEIEHLASGEAFLRTLERAPAPTLTLLDLHLHGSSGHEILTRLRGAGMLAPVLVLTSSWRQSDINESYRRGANAVLLKPVVYREVVDMCRSLCAFWLGRVERVSGPAGSSSGPER